MENPLKGVNMVHSDNFNAIKEFFSGKGNDPYSGTAGKEWAKPNFFMRSLSNRASNDLYVIRSQREQCTSFKESNFGPIWFYSIHYVVRGKGWYEVAGEKKLLTSGDIFIITPSLNFAYYPDENDPWEYIYVDIFGVISTNIDDIVGNPPKYVFQDGTNGFKEDFFRIQKSVMKTGEKSLETTGLLFLLIDKLKKAFGSKQDNEEINDYVKMMLDYIRANYKSITVKDIAENCHVSPEHLTRLSKQYIGYSVKDCITIFRIMLALDYLRLSTFDDNKIAELIGYADGKYFRKVFYSIFDKTPQEFRISIKMDLSEI